MFWYIYILSMIYIGVCISLKLGESRNRYEWSNRFSNWQDRMPNVRYTHAQMRVACHDTMCRPLGPEASAVGMCSCQTRLIACIRQGFYASKCNCWQSHGLWTKDVACAWRDHARQACDMRADPAIPGSSHALINAACDEITCACAM